MKNKLNFDMKKYTFISKSPTKSVHINSNSHCTKHNSTSKKNK